MVGRARACRVRPPRSGSLHVARARSSRRARCRRRRPVSTASAAVKASTHAVHADLVRARHAGGQRRHQRRARPRRRAARPAGRRSSDSSTLSVRSCRSSRPRCAPMAPRTAISFCAVGRAREQQVGHVGAGDQQHERHRAQQQHQRRAQVADEGLVQRLERSCSAGRSSSGCCSASRAAIATTSRARRLHRDARLQPRRSRRCRDGCRGCFSPPIRSSSRSSGVNTSDRLPAPVQRAGHARRSR